MRPRRFGILDLSGTVRTYTESFRSRLERMTVEPFAFRSCVRYRYRRRSESFVAAAAIAVADIVVATSEKIDRLMISGLSFRCTWFVTAAGIADS